MKAHLLIVEDEAVLYERLRRFLVNNHYTVDKYTPSVKDAIGRINEQRPDLVLLDIDLEGKLTGLDLGKELSETYHIPFIYVTNYSDHETFYQGLATHHQHFMVKTKPTINTEELLRVIQTVLHNSVSPKETKIIKEGVQGLKAYKEDLKNMGQHDINSVNVGFEDILFFSVKDIEREKQKIKLKNNYLWFFTQDNEIYFMRESLKQLLYVLPDYFVQINEGYIINILHKRLQGRVNGTHIKIGDKVMKITSTYYKEFEKKMDRYYHSS